MIAVDDSRGLPCRCARCRCRLMPPARLILFTFRLMRCRHAIFATLMSPDAAYLLMLRA